MPGVAETLARLKRARFEIPAATAAGRMSETAAFGDNPGALRMLSYRPSELAPGGPLVVVLHGCTQRAEAYAGDAGWLTLADRLGFTVLAPEQSAANNPNRCFNWFAPGDVARGGGEAASIHAMVAHLVRTEGVDESRVFVTGLSAGGAMTAAMLASYPDVFAAGAVVAGLPFGAADGVHGALRAMRAATGLDSPALGDLVREAAPAGGRIPRLSVWHGAADHTVQSANGHELARQWASVHGLGDAPTETQSLPGRSRAVWSQDGEILVELNLIQGLGHGTPLATGGAEPLGATAPYMLEAGVSSSLEIARFWDLTPAGPLVANDHSAAPEGQGAVHEAPTPASYTVGDHVMASLADQVPVGVQDVISRALRAAGLLR